MREILILLFSSIVITGCSSSNNVTTTLNKSIVKFNVIEEIPELKMADSIHINEILEKLCQSPRSSDLSKNSELLNWLNNYLEDTSYSVYIQEFDVHKQSLDTQAQDFLRLNKYKQDTFYTLNPYNQDALYTSANIIATKKASYPTEKTLIISAHYDTISNTKGVIDNGSGVAVVLEVANLLSKYPLPFNVEFILFGCEEYYLTGSKYYINQLSTEDISNIIGCINIDMVGESSIEQIILGTADGSNNDLTLLMKSASPTPFYFKVGRYLGLSDDASFDYAGIPSVLLSDEKVNPKWIDVDAPISALDVNKLVDVVNNLCNIVVNLG